MVFDKDRSCGVLTDYAENETEMTVRVSISCFATTIGSLRPSVRWM